MKYVNGDLDLNYEVIGDGVPIIMLNGYFNDLSAWKSCMEPLLKDRTTYKRIYLDYPGTGHSHISPTTKTYHDLLENVLMIVDHLIPGENFIIVGHSIGGLIARGILKRRFDYVDGIMLTCPVVKVNPKDRNIEKKLPHKLNVSEDRSKYIKGRINREVVKSRKKTDKDYLKEISSSSIDLKYNFDDLDQPFLKPALIVAGKQDSAVGYKDLYDLIDNYPRATLSILDNGKHDIQIEQNEIFDVLVDEWLSRIENLIKSGNNALSVPDALRVPEYRSGGTGSNFGNGLALAMPSRIYK